MQIQEPRLSNPDFSLRQVELSDIADWYSYLSIPGVVEHTSWNLSGPSDLHTLICSYSQSTPATSVRFALRETSTGRLVGTVGLNSISQATRSAELVYDLHPSHWGRGLASACGNAMIHWARTSLGCRRIWAAVLDTNLRSARVLEKLGFVREHELPAYRIVRGESRDFWLYGSGTAPAEV
jgi:ribosomal-protein-alanine N-acetyltransferase